MRAFGLLAAVVLLLGTPTSGLARERLTPGAHGQPRPSMVSQASAVRSIGHGNLDVERLNTFALAQEDLVEHVRFQSFRMDVEVVLPTTGGGLSGRIDTDIVPNSAAVLLDGHPVGLADDFDGWCRTLHTTPGRHHLTFVAPGYDSATVMVEVESQRVTPVKLELEPR
jgi:hypothetical protein